MHTRTCEAQVLTSHALFILRSFFLQTVHAQWSSRHGSKGSVHRTELLFVGSRLLDPVCLCLGPCLGSVQRTLSTLDVANVHGAWQSMASRLLKPLLNVCLLTLLFSGQPHACACAQASRRVRVPHHTGPPQAALQAGELAELRLRWARMAATAPPA